MLSNKKPRINKLLLTKEMPAEVLAPYIQLGDECGFSVHMIPFSSMVPAEIADFRKHKTQVMEANGLICTSRTIVDHFFELADRSGIKFTEEWYLFCPNEHLCNYVQKYMDFKKRRVFHGDRESKTLEQMLTKHQDVKFLVPSSEVVPREVIEVLRSSHAQYHQLVVTRTQVASISPSVAEEYDFVLFFSPTEAKIYADCFSPQSLGKIKIGVFGKTTAEQLQLYGFTPHVEAPCVATNSLVEALRIYLKD